MSDREIGRLVILGHAGVPDRPNVALRRAKDPSRGSLDN